MPAREAERAVGPRGRRAYWLFLPVFIFLISSAWAAKKPTNADCLACHGDATLTHEVNGKQVSLGVDEPKFNNSIHGAILTCVDCHDDLKSAPHEATPLKVDQTMSATVMRLTRLMRSARRAIGIPPKAYKTAKAVPLKSPI